MLVVGGAGEGVLLDCCGGGGGGRLLGGAEEYWFSLHSYTEKVTALYFALLPDMNILAYMSCVHVQGWTYCFMKALTLVES